MVRITQPRVDPLPTDIDLTGKTVVITGASSGIGLEAARQLLQLRASTVVLAVRNVAKGEACAAALRQDPRVGSHNPTAEIQVMQLDMDRYDSVQRFAQQVREEIPVVDLLLLLNAGIGLLKLERSPSGHDRTTQVNYHSNVLLIAELLAHLEAGAEKTGSPARISWVGSRMHARSSLEGKSPIAPGERVIEHMDSDAAYVRFYRYADSKLLCALFMYSLAPRVDPKKVVLNMMCPGMVNTPMSDWLPVYLRLPVNVVKAVYARPVEVGGWLILHSALVAGPESHGKFLMDKAIVDKAAFVKSAAGQEIQRKLWEETVAEMSQLTTLPVEFK
ncbi:uncharacterized protein ACLA_037100 [Aspergillus clavatus NRRL 1]|uniref:Short-chain dehydrogenase/reductase family protein n=1 Tax=Aspergillus clavatus (strain ATCC 1007 / CBS 513.65 / DSM 816 / NCTC 3887 / NRRL 1 / QM 1276 / 107) TaxID=344612 RepID=A1CK31_ASPCL|nr:uncharacterized protein ACLA_037100 [Aspergillus clavatus NRRL 1]EAW09505.1 conserved hypothetical protein [Aspergillus clavatus NRRL 1]